MRTSAVGQRQSDGARVNGDLVIHLSRLQHSMGESAVGLEPQGQRRRWVTRGSNQGIGFLHLAPDEACRLKHRPLLGAGVVAQFVTGCHQPVAGLR